MNIFGDVIFSYSRADAINDGVLIDVTDTPAYRDSAYKVPVALTSAAYYQCVTWDNDKEQTYQVEDARLYDVLFMCCAGIGTIDTDTNRMDFRLLCIKQGQTKPSLMTLSAVIGPDDIGNPCLTIMLPTED